MSNKVRTVLTVAYVVITLLIILGLVLVVGAQASKSQTQENFADLGTVTWDVATVTTSISDVPGYFLGKSCIPFTVSSSDKTSAITFVVKNAPGTMTAFGVANQYDTGVQYSFSTVSMFPYNYTETSPQGYQLQITPQGRTNISQGPSMVMQTYAYSGPATFPDTSSFTVYFHESVPSNSYLVFCSDNW